MDNYRFHYELEVRPSEVDYQNIVYNSHYLTYLDLTITNYFLEGLQFKNLPPEERKQFDFVLVKTNIEFLNTATFGDLLKIYCKTTKLGNKSFTNEFLITKENETDPILKAEIIYVTYNPTTQSTHAIPDFVRKRIKEFEGL